MNNVLFSHKSDEWETPQELFNIYNDEYHFTLDACATKLNRKCKRFCDKSINGLSISWKDEVVWCNPPYSQIITWVEKAYYECYFNRSTIVMLLPVRTDTKWFHNYVNHRSKIIFIKGRLKFSNSKTSAPFPSMVVIFSPFYLFGGNYDK